MSEWKEYRFAELLQDESISYGIVQPGSHSEVNSVPIIRVNNIKNGKISCDDVLKVASSIEQKYKRTRLIGGELLITVVGSIGECAIVPESLSGWNVARAVSVARIRNDFDKHFIKYSFKTDEIVFQMYGNTNDTVQPTLNLSSLKELKFLLPSFPEQKAIAGVLSSLDDKIDLLHRQNKTLEAMAETLFRQWFVEPCTDGLPEGWEEKPLKEVCVIFNGYAFQSPTYTDYGQKIIRTLNFSNHWIELNGLVYISEKLAVEFERFYLKRNDFLLVMVGASLGNFAIVTQDILPALQNQNMWRFRANEGFSQHYLNYGIRQIINESLHGASGSAREFFQKGVFYELIIPLPPLELLNRFEETAESLFSRIELNRYQIRTLEKLRDTLLPKLMSGEVRVSL